LAAAFTDPARLVVSLTALIPYSVNLIVLMNVAIEVSPLVRRVSLAPNRRLYRAEPRVDRIKQQWSEQACGNDH
jgi:hypothetical protein